MSYFTHGSIILVSLLFWTIAPCTGDTVPPETTTTTPPAAVTTAPSASTQTNIVWEEVGPLFEPFSVTTANGWRPPLKLEEKTQ